MTYKHIFATEQELINRNVPDDLIPIFFDYLGEPTETSLDLSNKHCLYRVDYTAPTIINGELRAMTDITFGHYCCLCDKLYLMESDAQILRHMKSRIHNKNLRKNEPCNPTEKKIKYFFKLKYFWWFCKPQREQEMMLRSIRFENITFNIIKHEQC